MNKMMALAPGAIALALSVPAAAELEQLGDTELSGISGQGGLTLEMALNAQAGGLSYFDDGNGITLEGLRVGAADPAQGNSFQQFVIDIGSNGDLLIDRTVRNHRIEFTDLRLSDNPGVSGGGVFFDQGEATTSFRMSSGGALSADGVTFDIAYNLTDGRLGYRTNGNEVFLDDVTFNLSNPGVTLDVAGDALDIRMPSLTGDFSVGAIRFSNNPNNHGNSRDVDSGALLPSFGGLSGDFDLSTNILFSAGGRFGSEGMTFDIDTTINSLNLSYLDDGNPLSLKGVTGFLDVNDLRIDVAPDWQGRLGLALTVDSLETELNIDALEIGAAGQSVGSFQIDALFDEQVVDGETFGNQLFVQAGGHSDAGPQGLRLATEFSLANADITYVDDGNAMVLSGLQAHGRGDVTLNVTREEVRGGTQFFDGLRIGFENVSGGYRLDGIRVGDKDAPLQGGTELLLALGVYPTFEFGDLDGHVTIGAGGASGEGLTINSDFIISDGRAGIIVNPFSEAPDGRPTGLWLSDLRYERHVRDMTVDVTPEGLAMIQGEMWGVMDIGNLRVGDKDSGSSFGRFVVQRFEKGSEMRISAGGAGQVCVGGTGGTASACASSGGRWEDRGEQGLTIGLKNVFAKAISETKKNSITWETNRQVDGSGNPINDTGMKLVLNDIHTSDGDGSGSNNFGVQTDLKIDVAQTKVVKRNDGADSNGVVGNRGDEKIMDPSAPAGYRYVSSPTEEEKKNRPLGFAVDARVQFKELAIDSVDLVHPTGGSATAIHGVSLQNFDIRANLTATPID